MTSAKYFGMDVHKESISIAVLNSVGKVVMECVMETKASVLLQCPSGRSVSLWLAVKPISSSSFFDRSLRDTFRRCQFPRAWYRALQNSLGTA
jgi:hypothetical protein